MAAWYDVPKPGRNAPCPCGSGLKSKRCCLPFFDRTPLSTEDRIGVFLTYGDLYPAEHTTSSGLRQELAAFDGKQLLRLLAVLSWYLGDDLFAMNPSIELVFVTEYADARLAKKVTAWLETRRAHKLFHRCTIPALYQLLMLAQSTDSPGQLVAEPNALPFLALKCNGLLEADYESSAAAARSDRATSGLLGALSFRNGFYLHRANWGSASARHWALLTKALPEVARVHPGQFFDVEASFSSHFGLTPIDWLAVVASVCAKFMNLKRAEFDENPQSFQLTAHFFSSLPPDLVSKVSAALMHLGATWEDHLAAMRSRATGAESNVQQFGSIYDRPLLRDGDTWLPLDMEFLRSQTTEGWYWALVRVLSAAGRNADISAARTAMGRAFEWVATEVLRPCLFAGVSSIWLDWDKPLTQPAGESQPDMVCLDAGVLFVIEVTASAVPPNVAVSCDPALVEPALERLWFGSSTSSAKLKQLQGVWSAARERRLRVEGLDWEQVDRVVPILVSLRHLPQNPGTMKWFRTIQRDHGCPEEFVRDLVLLDAEDWEELCASRLGGDSFPAVIGRWRSSVESDWGLTHFRNIEARERPRHPIVEGWLDDLWTNIGARLGMALQLPSQRPAASKKL